MLNSTVLKPSQENTTAPVGRHFRQLNHSVCDLQILPLEKNWRHNMNRKVRESFYINKFNSVVDGLNIKC